MTQNKINGGISCGKRGEKTLQTLPVENLGGRYVSSDELKKLATLTPQFSPGNGHAGILCLTRRKKLDCKKQLSTVSTV